MLSHFDDYPVHQTSEPVAHPGTSDRNFYDRYFFNGYTRDAGLFFGFALGLYPNRRVMDAAFAAVVDGRQHVLRASRLMAGERSRTTVGPLSVEVQEPMRRLRVRAAPESGDLAADLRFDARSPALEEPPFLHRSGHQRVMDLTRVTQLGTWEGWVRVGGARIELSPGEALGCRDRSWGIRPVGEPAGGAPGPPPQFFWLWAPVHFPDLCAHFDVNEDGDGRPWHANGVLAPLLPAGGDPLDASAVQRLPGVSHAIRWQPGTRRAESAVLTLAPEAGEPHRIELAPILTFPMRGLGYLEPEWGHGLWKGELAVHAEVLEIDKLPPLDPRNVHVQQLCRARMGERRGLGVLEQLVIGPHAPSGFRSLLDGAT